MFDSLLLQIIPMLEESMQIAPGSLQNDTELASLQYWDSIGIVMFINLVQENFSVELGAQDIIENLTAEQLARRIESLIL